jgi:hypothetical protein
VASKVSINPNLKAGLQIKEKEKIGCCGARSFRGIVRWIGVMNIEAYVKEGKISWYQADELQWSKLYS